MKKNQIFIKCGTEYKEMTKELLEACDLAGEIEKKFEKCGLKVLSENSGAGLQQNSEKVITEARFETKSSLDRKSTRLNSSHRSLSRMPSSA